MLRLGTSIKRSCLARPALWAGGALSIAAEVTGLSPLRGVIAYLAES